MQKNSVMFQLLDGILHAVEEIDSHNSSLDDILDNHTVIKPEIRRMAAHWLFCIYRYRLDTVDYIRKFSSTGKIKKTLSDLASAGVVHCIFQTGIARELSVNAIVEYTKKKYGNSDSRFINALLRKVCREMPQFKARLPEWCSRKWQKIYGKDFISTAEKCLAEEPVQIFRLRPGFEISGFEAHAVEVEDFSHLSFFETPEIGKCLESECFKKGGIYIQDIATGFSVELMAKYISSKIGGFIDVCGAPGGKAVMFHDMFPEWKITIGDRSAKRQKRTAENLQRCGVDAELLTCDASSFEFDNKYNAVFADVPCSNSGVFRKRPDALFRLNEKSLPEIVKIQHDILENICHSVVENGLLVYSTCSIEPEEDGMQISKFCERHPEFKLLAEKLTLPDMKHDGSYCAVLRRGVK